jgi:hypothetical protein
LKTGAPRLFRRSILLAAAGILAVVLTACTGRGGGQLPPGPSVGNDLFPDVVFTGPASFGFDFSCEDNSRLTGPTGQLRIQLAYTDHGTNPIGSSFSIHGIVDTIDPVLESAICIGQNPPYPDPNELTFLGRYRLVSPAPAGLPSTCRARETETTPLCRFEVIVRDNDMDRAPSRGDYFSINLTTVTTPCTSVPPDPTCSDLPAGFYTRAGLLSSGNLTVD